MNFLAEPGLGANAVEISHQQHPDHQLGINRGAPGMAVKRRKLGTQRFEVQKPVDLAQKMILGNVVTEAKPVEELTLLFDPPHHGRTLRSNT